MPFSMAMSTSANTQSLDLGRLLRMQAMVREAAQVEATYQAGGALTRAYLSLRSEMLLILEAPELAGLRSECERLFPLIEDPPRYAPALADETSARLAEAASEALIGLRRLQGWIQGLIDELTFHEATSHGSPAAGSTASANGSRQGLDRPESLLCRRDRHQSLLHSFLHVLSALRD